MTGPVAVVAALVRRATWRLLRRPSVFVPSVAMPVLTTLAFGGAFSAVTALPGFPTDDIASWYVPMAALQGAAYAGLGLGFTTLDDVETGFADRLALAPVAAGVLVAGPLVAAMARAAFPVAAALATGVVLGMSVPAGPAAVAVLWAAATLVALGAAGWGVGLAQLLGGQAAAGPMQAGVMLTFFLSTTQVPVALMEGWLHRVARVNPMTNVLRLARQGFLGDISWSDTWPGALVLLAGAAATSAFALVTGRRAGGSDGAVPSER